MTATGRRRTQPWPYACEILVCPDPVVDDPGRATRLWSRYPRMTQIMIAEAKRLDQVARDKRAIRLAIANKLNPLVPAVVTRAVLDDQGDVLRGPLYGRSVWDDPRDHGQLSETGEYTPPTQITGLRRVSMLQYLRGHEGSALSDDHVTAGRIYEDDCEASQKGVYPGSPQHEVRAGYGPGDYATVRAASDRSFKAAGEAVGTIGRDLLEHVVLLHLKPGKWAEKRAADRTTPTDRKVIMGRLVALLDILVEHYGNRLRRYPSAPGEKRRK